MGEINQAVLDEIRALSRAKGTDMLAKIVGVFLAEAPLLVQKIQDAIIANDQEALRRSAHFLRSGALGVGASRLAESCWELEHADSANDAKSRKAFMDLRARWQAAASELGTAVFD